MQESSLAPSLIVAVPQLSDPNFARTVTLVVEASEEGAFGIVINRVSPIKVADICAEQEMTCVRDKFVHIGGPVEQDRAWVLHRGGPRSEHSLEIVTGVWLTATWEALGQLAQSDEQFEVYLGYAGWGPGQLEREVTEGTWLLTEVESGILFDTEGDDMWRKVIYGMGLNPGQIGQGGGGVH